MDVLEVVNVECQVTCNKLVGLCEMMEYITKVVYHQFLVGREGSNEEREGTVVLER